MGKSGGVAAYPQGLFGRFEAMGGAQPPDPECQHLATPLERDRCEKEFLLQTVWPLKGYAVVRDARGDSTVLALDSAGGYRVGLPVGLYTVCVEADGLTEPDRCRDSLEVKAGVYTPFSRPFPRALTTP